MKVFLIFTIWIFIEFSSARAAKLNLSHSRFLVRDLNYQKLHDRDFVSGFVPRLILPRGSPPSKHREGSGAEGSKEQESQRPRRRVHFADPLVMHRANSPPPEPRISDEPSTSVAGLSISPTRSPRASARVGAYVAPEGRIRVNTSPGLDPTKKKTFTTTHDGIGRHGENPVAATASTEVATNEGTGDARASGNTRVSASMSTGPRGTGRLDCRLPGQPPIEVHVKQSSKVRVNFDNTDPRLGQATVFAKLDGIGKAKVRAYN